MTTRPDTTTPQTPDAEQMLAYVEGAMDVPEELRFRRSLASAPEVLARLDAMRRDRAALRASLLRDPVVPTALVRSTQELVAREALFTATPRAARALTNDGHAPTDSAHDTSDRLRLAGLSSLESRPRRSWNSSLLVTPLSMAAALALVAGGLLLTLRGPTHTPPDQRHAHAATPTEHNTPDDTAERPSTTLADSGARTPGQASSNTAAPPLGPTLAQSQPPGRAAGASPSHDTDPLNPTPTLGAYAGSTRLIPGVVAHADLLNLAESHRLALRVSTDQPDQLVAALDQVAALSDAGTLDQALWRVRSDLSTGLAPALGVALPDQPAPDPTIAANPATHDPSTPDAPPTPEAIADADRWLLRPTRDALAVYMAEVDLTQAALDALRREFGDDDAQPRTPSRPRARVGFTLIQDPITDLLALPRPDSPTRDLLWWPGTPAVWGRRTLVPVIIEQRWPPRPPL